MEKKSFQSLCELFHAQVARKKDSLALKGKRDGQWRVVTWEGWQKAAFEISNGLLSLGVMRGERIALISENCPEWVIADQGILHAGCVNVAIYPTSIPSQISYILQNCQARAVFVSSQYHLKKVLQVYKDLPALQYIIYFDIEGIEKFKEANGRIKIISFKELREAGKAYTGGPKAEEIWKTLTHNDMACLIYTSGTTGNPKGVELTHGNLVSNALACNEHLKIRENAEYFSFLPLCHAFERMTGYYTMLVTGTPVAYAESMDKILDNISEIRPTYFCTVPRVLEKAYAKIIERARDSGVKFMLFDWALKVGKEYQATKHRNENPSVALALQHLVADQLVFSKVRERFGGRVEYIVSGGGPLAAEIAAFFDAFGMPVLQGYGLTEASPVCSCNMMQNYRYDSIGLPLPGVQFKIMPDGEIWVKGPNVMRGYYQLPEATAEALTDDGWLKTGDVGVIDPDGHIRITDRKKDIIVTSGGKNVSPQNIEFKLKINKMIEQICIIGDRQKFIAALIVPNFANLKSWAQEHQVGFQGEEGLIRLEEVRKLFQGIIDEVNRDLASYESIKKFTLLPHEFSEANGELTPTLKIKRRVVQEKYSGVIRQMYEGGVTEAA